MARITADLDPITRGLMEAVRAMEERLRTIRPVLAEGAADLESDVILASFGSATSPLGESWAPLKEGGGRPLADADELRSGIFAEADASGRSIIFGARGKAGRIARAHALGTRHLPRRSMFPTDSSGSTSFASGRAATWLERLGERVMRWLLLGQR